MVEVSLRAPTKDALGNLPRTSLVSSVGVPPAIAKNSVDGPSSLLVPLRNTAIIPGGGSLVNTFFNAIVVSPNLLIISPEDLPGPGDSTGDHVVPLDNFTATALMVNDL